MANLEYKDLRKADWQRLADSHGVEYKSKSTVRYLVEKIAEIIGVDDKIVDTEELKSKVCDVLNADSSNETTINAEDRKVNEEGVDVVEVEQDLSVSKLDALRKECDAIGLAWGEKHTETDLQQLINAVKGSGSSVELDIDKLDYVPEEVNPATINPATFNPAQANEMIQFENMQKPVITASTIKRSELDVYRNSFTQTIRNHFRTLSIHEINDMFTRDSYPFDFEIRRSPQNSNQIEIILTASDNEVRVPSDNPNDWIQING